MNIMRKLWVSGTGSTGSGNGGNGTLPGNSGGNSAHSISLGLMHLRKLFGDYVHSPSDDKIYNMLPLFCKVFSSSSAADMIERFPEINSFCQTVGKLMVAEVRKRATNQSTEAAAISIIRFFEAASANEEDSHGWTLLSTLNLLAAGDENLIIILTAASVPSTLVKCLYLFFDLPEIQPPERKGPTSDFSPMERRLLLQKIFVQLLIRLSSHPAPAEELAKRDDLALLFSAVTSWCPPQNAMWRKSSSEVLMTISTQIIHSPPVLSYIHNKSCICLCVENLRRGSHLTPLEITEMVLTLFCFLKDSCDLSPVLLDDFRSSQGYQFFVETLLKLESDLSSESQEAIRNLVLVISSLTMCGYTVLKPNMANVESLFSLPTFQLPPSGVKGCTVRNLQAFQVLQSLFTKSTTSFLSCVVLDAISSVFKADHSNYFIVDSVLPQMAERLITKNPEVHTKFLEIVEFVVFQLQFTPCKELIAISRILKNDLSETNCASGNQAESSTYSRPEGSNRNSAVLSFVTTIDVENETRLKLLCVKMLLNLAKHNALFKDVYREIGILEALITCLHRFGSDIQDPNQRSAPDFAIKEELGLVVIELLTLVLTALNANVNIFRENGGPKCALQLAAIPLTRAPALSLIQQLLMSQGGEEDMASALVALHSSDVSTSVGFKIEILAALLICFRESHRARCNFRKAGGFLYLMSVLVSMEGLLLQQNISSGVIRERMHLVQLVFTAFALSMRFEPANAKLFQQEICLPSLADTLRLLGCFSRQFKELPSKYPLSTSRGDGTSLVTEENIQLFHSIFTTVPTNLDPQSYQGKVPLPLVLCIFLYRLLYDLAIDSFERNFPPSVTTAIPSFRSSPRKQISGDIEGLGSSSSGIHSECSSPIPPTGKKLSVGSLNLTPPTPEPVLIHSSVVIVMVKLIPSIWHGIDFEDEVENTSDPTPAIMAACQLYCAELIKSLVRSEKNQQLMAQAGLLDEILERCAAALSDESHYLHSPIHYAFERVATHFMSPKDFRRFFRLGNPLNCDRLSTQSANISTISALPVSRVTSLVSMTMSKSGSHHHSMTKSQTSSQGSTGAAAPFVEFDMSAEGFGALFLPSLAPHNIPSSGDFGSAGLLATGIGMGERVFPGVTGMSYSTWFSVDKFSDPRTDPHPVRLLTIIKENGTSQRLCLCIVVSARDKAMMVSTRESSFPAQGFGEWEPDGLAGSVRVWCPELLHEGQWHHLFFTFSTSSSHSFAVYVNGRLASTGKLEYPNRSRGASYSAFIGTPPIWRKTSRLTWRQGVAHFFEDWVPGAQTIHSIYKLGPEYPGSWQAVKIQSETPGTMIAEDKIIFGLNALAVSQLTLAKIRKIYSKTDAKAIAKQLGLSSHENATPISILHNSAAHLIGPARTLGGVTIGYIGVRVFTPLPVSKTILSIGGIQLLIGLVAMANTGEMLYASLKAFVCVVKSNAQTSLVSETAWQTLGFLLKRKKHLLTMRVLHLVFGLVSSDASGGNNNLNRENRSGFVELLGDIDIWCPFPMSNGNTKSNLGVFDSGPSTPENGFRKQPSAEDPTVSSTSLQGLVTQSVQKFEFLQSNVDLEKALYEHFLQLLNDEPKASLDVLREANIVPQLLRRLTLSSSSINQGPIFLLLSHLLAHKGNASAVDLITFGHFIAGMLPPLSKRETMITDGIELRNKGLQLIHSLMYTGKVLNVGFCDELVHRLGFDFVLLFTTSNLHASTVLWAFRILLLLITSSSTLKNKFRDGSHSAWCFGKTAIAAQQCGGSLRNSYAMLPLKRQETRDGDDSSASGTPVSGGPVSVIAGGLSGKSGKGLTGGWARLSWNLAQRCEDIRSEGTDTFPSEIWLILCAMVLSQPCRNVSLKIGDSDQLTLDAIWSYVFALPANRMTSSLYGKGTICPDAIITLLTLIRCFITAESALHSDKNTPGSGNGSVMGNPNMQLFPHSPITSPGAHSDVASCLVQFLCYLYSHTPEFQPTFTSSEILSALAATVMPIDLKAGIGALVIDNVAVVEAVGDLDEVKVFADSESLVVVENPMNPIQNEPLVTGLEVGENQVDPEDCGKSEQKPEAKALGASPLPSMENLMNHPAKKIILDFLRMLIIDWMSTSASQSQSKTGVGMNIVIDTVLEAGSVETECAFGNNGLFPSNGQYSTALLSQFHTNLLGTLLDHLIACDLDRMTGYMQAVAHFLSRLVDKLWLESFARDPQVVFDFIHLLVTHCKTKRVPPTTTDMIYNSLNRVVLFILSRKSNQWDKVEALKKIRSVRSIIFGSGNHQQDFFGCLVHVLMQLVDGLPIALESGNRTQWHVRVMSNTDESIVNGKQKNSRSSTGLDSEISKTAEKVWEDLFISKKPMVEDVFKITFPSPQPPSLSSLRDDIGDSANKLWLTYVATETTPGLKKSNLPSGMSQSWEIHQQLQSKLQKVTGGLTRLAGRSGIRKESEKEKTIKDVVSQWNEAKKCQIGSNKHLMIVKDVLEVHERCHLENMRHLNRYVRDTLLPQLEHELTRERGLWGPINPSHLDKWMLDTTEGPCRMRKKLMRNEMFYVHYPYLEQQLIAPTAQQGNALCSPKVRRINPPVSRDAKEFHKKFKHQPSFINDICFGLSMDDVEDSSGNGAPSGSSSSDPNISPKTSGIVSVDDPFSDGSIDTASDPDNQSMLFRLIGTANEKISQMFRVAQIHGLDTAEGLLLFGKDHFYLISGFTILAKTREIKDMYYLPANMYEPILPPQCYGSGPSPAKPHTKTHSCWKFSYEDIREVHKRRYLLQPIALEIFCSDGINYLLAFPRKVRNVVFQKFTSVSKNLSDSGTDAKQSVAGQRRSTSVEQSAGIFSSLIGDTTVTQRWVRGEISNFQYLMYMNTLAGRSYNDLMQYPVFPWILADYDSPFLDFSSPATFRDLSKPMGVQTNSRLVQFVKRFKEWDDPHGETPPYHYGTHYSSAMIVCSYLVRMEPFAQHFLRLQGGHFDLADRMFHSIKEAWTSASMHNMADVKELIPEFFYLPEFLQNSNNFDLGFKQNGVALGDVLLPPWAKDDPREFIRVHREALECDYVSQHLHEWIDLVFGYKQQGQPAIDAVNVFHHLFYEGNVDIYTIDDPLKKNATIGFINNFGQIPKQLFKKPHPIKRVNSSGGSLSSGIGIIKQYNILEGQNPLMVLAATAGNAVASQSSNSSGEKLFYHHVDHLRPTLSPIKELKGPVGQIMALDRANLIIAVEQNKFLMSSNKYISWGFADGSVRVSNVDTDRPHFIWEQCQQQLWMGCLGEIVTCTAASEKLAITGSTNTVISVWEFVDKEFRLKSHLYGHSEAITCLTCSPSYNIIVSGSKDATCIVWDLARLSFVHQLVTHTAAIDAVGVNELTGDIATCDGSWLRLWSINGDIIGQIDTAGVGGGGGMSQGILCISFSYLNEWDSDNLILTGSTDGIVRMWSVRYAQVPEEDIAGNQDTDGLLVVHQSITDDSSMITGSDSDDQPEDEELNDMNPSEDDSTQDRDTEAFSVAEVFDPDKDRDSLEDLREEATTARLPNEVGEKETQLEKVKSSVRRQRALSSGTSPSRHDSNPELKGTPKLRSDSSLTTAEKRAKRKSDIPKQGSNSSVATENEDRRDKLHVGPSIRSSKSENSLSIEMEDSFEILSETEVASLRKEEQDRKLSYGSALRVANVLKDGHVWQKRLVFRGKLTMHTAYDRQDNKEPASITAISVSRDHRNVYVGDARGRVFAWTCSDSVAGRADHWVPDNLADSCGTCKANFSLQCRRHHCRSCGNVFCSKCSRFESEIFRLRILRPVRVCQPCFVQLKGDARAKKFSSSSEMG